MSSLTPTIKHWRSKPTVSRRVSEPMEWPTHSAVDVVSIVDHNSQKSVSAALLKKFCPLTGPGHGRGLHEQFSQVCHSCSGHELRWSLQKANFIRRSFQAERLGLGALAVIVDDGFHNSLDA